MAKRARLAISDTAAEKALRRLRAGNRRFVARTSCLRGSRRRLLQEFVRQQRPYATILCCSDSRVPPELIFDAGLGDLFVVRVAGNVLSAEVAGSIQYSVAYLGTTLVVVMGHGSCGAVQAALDAQVRGEPARSRIQALVAHITPALSEIDLRLPPDALIAAAVEANVRWTVRRIKETPEAGAALAAGSLALAGAVYDLHTGRVRFLS